MPETPKKTFAVPSYNLPALREKVAKLNRKIERLNKKHGASLEAIGITEGEPYEQEFSRTNEAGESKKFTVVMVPVTTFGQQPKLDGWEFVAAIDSLDGGNVLRVVPGAEVADGELARFRDCKPECEHCQTDRYRKGTFIVRKVQS